MRVLTGDCRAVLPTLDAESVQCCVTSPPYFGLRDYGVAGQIGLEQSPDAYVAEMVAVFREVRRVLRGDGVVWCNIGDSYAASGVKTLGRNDAGRNFTGGGGNKIGSGNPGKQGVRTIEYASKPKDLLGIPWRVAFALQADGWWLRSDCIWSKPNPMPESVRDRPTKAHEYVFLLTKSASYFYDANAVREEETSKPQNWTKRTFGKSGGTHRKENVAQFQAVAKETIGLNGRNLRTVWQIATRPTSLAHFATMPPDLAERCIKAGTSASGCCPHCGAPWERVVEKGERDIEHMRACGADASGAYNGQSTKGHDAAGVQNASDVKRRILEGMRVKHTTAWRQTCTCRAHSPVPCTILDPFFGAGTTGLVAGRLGRHCIGIELNPSYVQMGTARLTADAPVFAEITA